MGVVGRRTKLVAAVCALALCAAAPVVARAFVFVAPEGSSLAGERSGPDVFTIGGIEQECKEGFFQGYYTPKVLVVEPIFDKCTAKALAGLTSNYVLYGCTFQVRATGSRARNGTWEAPVDLECPTTYKMRWLVFESEEQYEGAKSVCTTTVPPQKNAGTAEVTNLKGSGDVAIRWHLSGMRYESFGSALYCGIPEGVAGDDASYQGEATIHATDALEKSQRDLAVRE